MPTGAAIGTAVATVGSAVMGSNATKQAGKDAAAAQQGATQAQLELGRESLDLQEQMFNQGLDFNKMQAGVSYDMLTPTIASGLGAQNIFNALMGITPVEMGANPYNTPQAATAAAPPAPGGNALGGGGAVNGGIWGGPWNDLSGISGTSLNIP